MLDALGLAQLLAEVLGDACGPQEFDLQDQIGHGDVVILFQRPLYEVPPHVLNEIQIVAFVMPINDQGMAVPKGNLSSS
jgi:hypothetical protein